MLPHEREMAARLKDRPFTLLGINSDESRSALKEIIEKEKVTWPNIFGGPTATNEFASRWNVYSWPTIYVLDHKGVIRFKGLRDETLEKAVIRLLDEMPTAEQKSRR